MSTISDVLNRKGVNVLTINSSASVFDAIALMSDANIGAVVIEEGGEAAGIFTERDYMRKIVLKGRSSRETQVKDVMSSPLITIEPSEATQVGMETMTECRCRHLVVMDEDNNMLGIVSLGDLVKFMLQEKEAEVEQLSQYIAGSY
jgi:CBS domain-containing protein